MAAVCDLLSCNSTMPQSISVSHAEAKRLSSRCASYVADRVTLGELVFRQRGGGRGVSAARQELGAHAFALERASSAFAHARTRRINEGMKRPHSLW